MTVKKSFDMTAKYDGECALCDEAIRQGLDRITQYDDGGEMIWVHLNCVREIEANERARKRVKAQRKVAQDEAT